jgi:hypothetical protein
MPAYFAEVHKYDKLVIKIHKINSVIALHGKIHLIAEVVECLLVPHIDAERTE